MGIIVGAALAIAAVVMTGGAALVPLLSMLLTAAGVSASTALTVATIMSSVAAIAVVSTIGTSALNIIDTWGNIDDPAFNTWQSVLNWTSIISNGLYSIGMLYNSIEHKSGRNFNSESKGGGGATKGGSGNVREQLLGSVSNDKLKNCINEMYRPGATTGNGGLADAIRHELTTGELVGGKSHITKGLERVRNLENIIAKQNLNSADLKIATDLLNDLKSALELGDY